MFQIRDALASFRGMKDAFLWEELVDEWRGLPFFAQIQEFFRITLLGDVQEYVGQEKLGRLDDEKDIKVSSTGFNIKVNTHHPCHLCV